MRYFSTDIPKIISKEFGDEVVLANYDNGIYYSLAGSAAAIWLALRAGAADEVISREFQAAYPDVANAGALAVEFIDRLSGEGLIVPAEKPAIGSEWRLVAAPSFAAPELERFDDLHDLLLLDPVHDVEEGGWPLRANNDS